MKIKSITIGLLVMLFSTNMVQAQKYNPYYGSQNFAIKTNVSGLLLGNLNAAGEFLVNTDFLGKSLTVNIPVSYNPFTYRNNVKLKHIAIQPELRMWLDEPFRQFFVGVHAHYAYYNAGRVSGFAKSLKERRYQGSLFGMGVSGGYQHTISDRFSLEAALGMGYARMDHEIYRCAKCGTKIGSEKKNYFGPTKAAISVVYMIK